MNKYLHAIVLGIAISFIIALLTACGGPARLKPVYIQHPLKVFSPPRKNPPRPTIKLECPECYFELEAPPLPTFFVHYYIIR